MGEFLTEKGLRFSYAQTYTAKHGAGNLRVWGYRNVWARFHPAEADAIIPVSLNP